MSFGEINNNDKKQGGHVVTLIDRSQLSITGINDVLSFDEHVVEVLTEWGDVTVDGDDLKISTVNIESGELTLTGRIFGFCYNEKKQKKSQGLFGKKSL